MPDARKLTEAIIAVVEKGGSDAAIEDALKTFIREYIQEEAEGRSEWLRNALNQVIRPGNVAS